MGGESGQIQESSSDTEDTKSTTTNPDTPISCLWYNKESCSRLWHTFNNYWKLIFLGIAVFVYNMVGGLIFTTVERPNEIAMIEEAQMAQENAIASLTSFLLNNTNLTEEEAANMTVTLLQLGQTFADASERLAFDANPIWDFSSAVFFCSTVITTIGYGTIAPATATGQILFIFYAIFGIPLALLFLAMIGNVIEAWVNHVLRPVERRWGPLVSRAVGSILLFLTVLIFFILIPGGIYYAIEDWNFRESVYFTVVTLTTVGFGDFVPAQASEGLADGVGGLYKILSSLWLWIGLALVAALISEIQDLLKSVGHGITRLRRRLKRRNTEKEEMKDVRSTSAEEAAGESTMEAVEEPVVGVKGPAGTSDSSPPPPPPGSDEEEVKEPTSV